MQKGKPIFAKNAVIEIIEGDGMISSGPNAGKHVKEVEPSSEYARRTAPGDDLWIAVLVVIGGLLGAMVIVSDLATQLK